MKKIIVASALAALACGCITVNKNDGGNSCLKPAVVKDKVHIKYELGKDRVNATDQVFCLFGMQAPTINFLYLKRAALLMPPSQLPKGYVKSLTWPCSMRTSCRTEADTWPHR